MVTVSYAAEVSVVKVDDFGMLVTYAIDYTVKRGLVLGIDDRAFGNRRLVTATEDMTVESATNLDIGVGQFRFVGNGVGRAFHLHGVSAIIRRCVVVCTVATAIERAYHIRECRSRLCRCRIYKGVEAALIESTSVQGLYLRTESQRVAS